MTLKYAKNAFAAGALPGRRCGSSRRSPRPHSRLGGEVQGEWGVGRGYPSPHPTLLLDPRIFGAATWLAGSERVSLNFVNSQPYFADTGQLGAVVDDDMPAKWTDRRQATVPAIFSCWFCSTHYAYIAA